MVDFEIRPMTEADLDACASLAADHDGRRGLAVSRERARFALERAGEVWYFTGTDNAASFALHARVGFREVTREFSFPRVTLELGGILCRLTAATWTP